MSNERILRFRLSVGDMIYDDLDEYFMDSCKSNCFAEYMGWVYIEFEDHTFEPSLQRIPTSLWFVGKTFLNDNQETNEKCGI